jgi:hypothetical protein
VHQFFAVSTQRGHPAEAGQVLFAAGLKGFVFQRFVELFGG